MADVILEHVNKKFGKFTAVQDADFHIKSGEFFTFLGPSGCGKTTTLRMVAGFSYPSEGRILFDQRDVTTLAPNKRDIGMVFQNYALFPHMTIGENVAFGLKIRKINKQNIKKRVARALDLVHLSGYENRKVHEISGGQQQRVALARALVIEPKILLLDEPLSNLDAKLRDDTRSEIKRLQMELGITTIYVTHDQSEAMAISDRILIMKNGIMQQIGTPYEVYAKPKNSFVAEFIGKHSIFIAYIEKIENDKIYIKLKDGTSLVGLKENAVSDIQLKPTKEVLVAIRPECVEPYLNQEINRLDTKVIHSEFTGMSANYQLDLAGDTLKATIINQGEVLKKKGESLAVHIPVKSLYFLNKEVNHEER